MNPNDEEDWELFEQAMPPSTHQVELIEKEFDQEVVADQASVYKRILWGDYGASLACGRHGKKRCQRDYRPRPHQIPKSVLQNVDILSTINPLSY